MNTHKHARLTFARRHEMFRQMTERGLRATAAAFLHGVTPPAARRWLGRYPAEDEAGVMDASFRPKRSPRAIAPACALLIVELRQRRMLQARIARTVGVSGATVSRVMARAGLSKLCDLELREPVQRYEHCAPGELLHIGTKKLGRIERPSHRVIGNRRDSVDGAGRDMLFVAIDDHARIAFKHGHPDEKKPQAGAFLHAAVASYAGLGITIKRLLTNNGSAFRSKDFAMACQSPGIRHMFTCAYSPQTNGKAERLIQSALREWAYGWTYQNSAQRTHALASWQHHYNWHRPPNGIDGVPAMSRVPASGNNVLTLHT